MKKNQTLSNISNISIISLKHIYYHKCKNFKNTHSLSLCVCLFLVFWLQPVQAQQKKTDSLYSVLETSKPDTNRVNILYALSESFYDSDPYKAIDYANQGLTLSNKIAFTEGISICLNALGLSYYHLGKFDTALIYFEKRYKIATEINDRKGIATTCDNMGIIYIHFGKVDKALELRNKAIEIYEALNEKSLLASGYTWIGNIYKEKGEYAIALDYYLKSLKLFEAENDDQSIGYPILNISSIYRYMKQYDKASEYALNAKNKFEIAKNPNGVGESLYRLAIVYNEEKDYDNSIKYLSEAKNIFDETKNSYSLTLVNLLLGENYRNKGDIEIALNFFNTALVSAQSIGNIVLISSLIQNIGTIYYYKGDYVKALANILKSDSAFTEIKDIRALRENSTNFIEIYSRLNQPDSLLKYFQRYRQLSDTIFNEQTSKSIAEMQIRYETEKKDQQIQLHEIILKNKNLIIQGSLAGGGLVLVSLVLIIILYRKKNQAYKQLVYQNLIASGLKQLLICNDDLTEDNENGIQEVEMLDNYKLDDELKKQIIECLTKLIENKAFTESGLTLKKLAEKCGTNRTYLSIVINETFKANFNTFINKLRIDEAIRILSLPGSIITLKELYQKLGFNSYSVFNEAFKKFIGVTPAFFLKTLKKAQNILNSKSVES
jgi:tetratricopeptide (TPR) repeat protein